MESLNLSLDAAWAAGLVLAMTRVAAFVVVSPWLSRAVPLPGRVTVVVALGLFFASPTEAPLTLAGLLGAGLANAAVGGVLGYLTGLVFHVFAVAGNLIDTISGLAVASVLDPTSGEQGAIFSQLFNLAGLALFFLAGGLELLVRGLALSIEAIALDGSLSPTSDLADLAVRHTGTLLLVAAELALPVLSALFLLELVLGIASRFAPQANVFLLGLPAKLLLTLVTAGVVLLLFPEALDGLLRIGRDTFVDALAGLRPTP